MVEFDKIPCANPKGTTNPDYYLIGNVTSELEINNDNLFDPNAGKSNSYLLGVLNSLNINELNCRFNKLVRCLSDNNRKVDESVLEYYRDSLFEDIEATNPKIIIGLGGEVGSLFLGNRFRYMKNSRGRLFDVEVNGKEYKFLVTYSPSFITKEYNENSKEDTTEYANNFYYDISYCQKYIEGKLVDISKKSLEFAKTFDEFKEYYDKYLVDAELPSYDIESNAKDPRCSDFRIVGYSLAPNGSTGIYVIRKTLEYEMPEEDWDKCVELTKEYLSSRTCLVHNIMYEKPATLNEWGLNIINFEDSLIKARLLLGGKTGAGLKEQCILNLGYPEWDADLGEYISNFAVLRNNLHPTSAGNNRWDFEILKRDGFKGLMLTYYGMDSVYNELTKISQSRELVKEELDALSANTLDKRSREVYNALISLEALVYSYYENKEDSEYILDLIGKEAVNLIEVSYEGILPYSSIPMKIITKYGAMDSVGTQDLNKFLSERMDRESTSTVNLWDGYKVMKQHFVVGSHLEMNGLYWNEDVAKDNWNWLATTAKKSLRNCIMSGFLDDQIFNNSLFILQEYVQNNMMDYVREVLGDFDMQKSGIKLLNTGKRISYKNIIWELPKEFLESKREFVISESKKRIMDDNIHPNYSDLKYIFNPASNKNVDILNKILVTKEIQIGYLIVKIRDMLESDTFDINSVPMPDKLLFKTIHDIDKYNKSDECTKKITSRQLFLKIDSLLSNINIKSKIVYNIITEAVRYKLDGTSEPVMLKLFDYYEAIGIDIEDESTYTKEFEFFYNFRMYKKCTKLISSYIDGSKIGRGSLWVVNNKDIEENKLLPIRTRMYNWSKDKSENESYLMQPSWHVCTAETMRWRSGMHTLPMGRVVKGMYTSRYKGGVISAPDYSQLEVRITAGLSGCQKLLDAFRNGEDVHLKTAMGIFNKPADQITKVERRFSKMGCRVGSSKVKLLDGTIKTMKEIYESGMRDFYTYSFDLNTNEVVPGHVVDVQLTKYVKKLRKLTFSNGFSEECTEDHLYLCTDGEYRRADQLEGHQIETLFTRIPEKGAYAYCDNNPNYYEQYRDVRYSYECGTRNPNVKQTRYGKWNETHIMVANKIYGSVNEMTVDHINNDSLNNDPSNIQLLSSKDNRFKARFRKIDNFGHFKTGCRIIKSILDNNEEVNEESFNAHRNIMFNDHHGIITWDKLQSYEYSIEELLNIYDELYSRNIDESLKYNPIEKFKKTEIECITCVKSEEVTYEEEIPVYDLSVETHHNYAAYLGDNTSVFTHNTFRILYGSTPEGFASQFLDGDVEMARKIFDGFYSTYPEVKQWMDKRHEEVERTGKVSCEKVGYFINIDVANDPEGIEGAYRKAGNYPVQSQGSMVAGYVLSQINQYILDNHLMTKPICFIHDSLEFDIHPSEIFKVSPVILKMMNDIPINQFGIPTKADVTFGTSMGMENEAKSMEFESNGKSGILVLEGFEDDLDEMYHHWKDIAGYRVVEYEDIGDKEEVYTRKRELFQEKLALGPFLGKTRYLIKRKFKIII